MVSSSLSKAQALLHLDGTDIADIVLWPNHKSLIVHQTGCRLDEDRSCRDAFFRVDAAVLHLGPLNCLSLAFAPDLRRHPLQVLMTDIFTLDQKHHMAGDVLCMTADPLQCAQSQDRLYHVPDGAGIFHDKRGETTQ